MDSKTLKFFIKTKIFKFLVIAAVVYFLGFGIYQVFVIPNPELIQSGGINIWRDIFHIVYWRYALDWLIIFGMLGAFIALALIFSHLKKFIATDKISTYILPIILMICNAFGMIAIDLAITVFADTGINGTWETETLWFLGMKAQEIYHQFFFWFMPFLIINGIPLMELLHQDKHQYHKPLKILFIMMAGYSFTLGAIDPIVCHFVWGNWAIFGEWNMVNQGGIFATGWISHYALFGLLWIFGAYLLEKSYKELIELQKKEM